jgi:hypothetical protein
MDITLLSKNSIKIRGKKAAFIIDPLDIQKNNADAIILLSKKADLSKVDEYRVVISGTGEYEVAGVKISGVKAGEGVVFSFFMDGVVSIFGRVGRGSSYGR